MSESIFKAYHDITNLARESHSLDYKIGIWLVFSYPYLIYAIHMRIDSNAVAMIVLISCMMNLIPFIAISYLVLDDIIWKYMKTRQTKLSDY